MHSRINSKTETIKYALSIYLLGSALNLVLGATFFPTLIPEASARGGGGGRGFGGGGGRDFGDRGMGDRGYGDRGYGDRGLGGYGDLGDRDFADRDIGNTLDHTSESALRDGADQVWNSGSRLATDGGFGRAMDTGRGLSAAAMTNRGVGVRNAFRNDDAFRGDWWGRYPDAWGRGWGDDWYWGYGGWSDLASFWDYPVDNAPVDYDYGNNITYQGDTVYYGNQPSDSAANYYAQAQTIAQASMPPAPKAGAASAKVSEPAAVAAAEAKDPKDWKSLGVFSLTQGDQTDSTMIFQLAVDKKGAIRGNYYNALTKECKPVYGSIDKKNMRAAFEVSGNKSVVYDTGLSNLLQPQSPILVHFSKTNTEQWTLVRLEQPKAS